MKFNFKIALVAILLVGILVGGVAASMQINYTASKGGVFNGGFETGNGTHAAYSTGQWIGAEQYGWWGWNNPTSGYLMYDANVSHSGAKSLKFNITTTGGGYLIAENYDDSVTAPSIMKHLPPLKANTKYKSQVWIKTSGVTNTGGAGQFAISLSVTNDTAYKTGSYFINGIGGTQDWTAYNSTFTTPSDVTHYGWYFVLNNEVGSVWIDDITLEEVVTDTQATARVVKLVVQGVTSTDNIDQSLDSGWAAGNTYALTNAVNEGATHIQTFTPTKKLITNISINCVATGTGLTWYLVVHDASNNALSSNSFTPVAGVNSIPVPALWTSGNLHFHVYASATTGTPTLKSASANDLETGSYIEYYAKNTEDVQVDVNGERLNFYSSQPVDSGSVLMYFPMDVSFADISQYGRGTSATGATIGTTTKKFGNGAGDFNTTIPSYVKTSSNNPDIDWNGSYSMSFWYKDAVTASYLLGVGGVSGGAANSSIYAYSSPSTGLMQIGFADSAGAFKSASVGLKNDGQWHYVVVNKNATHISASEDGVRNNSTALSGVRINSGLDPFGLGCLGNYVGGAIYQGFLDDVVVSRDQIDPTIVPTLPFSQPSAPEGLLSGAIVDTDKGQFSYENGFNSTSPGKFSDAFSSTAGGYATDPLVINGWGWSNAGESIQSASDTTARSLIFKLNVPLTVTGINVTATGFNNNVNTGLVEVSGDNINYNTIIDYPASAAAQTVSASSNFVTGNRTFYLRLSKDTTNGYIRWDMLNVTTLVDTADLPNQSVIAGTNYYNISSNGRADSASQDPSLQAIVWLMGQGSFSTLPIVQWLVNTQTIMFPGKLIATDESLNIPTSWSWNPGDGSSLLTTEDITYQYLKRGVWNMSHTATNSAGSNTSYKTIRVMGSQGLEAPDPKCSYTVSRNLDVQEKAMTDCKVCGRCEGWHYQF